MMTVECSPLLPLLSEALSKRLRQNRHASNVDVDADLIELGLVDSQTLLDIILEVEGGSGQMFDAEAMDFESGVTLRRLAAAFTPA
ncbi:MAG TPA: hypothetical protein VMB34_29995 [Acetobacteraceae bacterium]|nr:hypothetical protein [Acetobacteraceae bacterium]